MAGIRFRPNWTDRFLPLLGVASYAWAGNLPCLGQRLVETQLMDTHLK